MPQARTRFDEFQAYHIQVADGIHLLVRCFFISLFECGIDYWFLLLRVNFFPGTGTISEAMKKRCVMNADTRVHSRQYPSDNFSDTSNADSRPYFQLLGLGLKILQGINRKKCLNILSDPPF